MSKLIELYPGQKFGLIFYMKYVENRIAAFEPRVAIIDGGKVVEQGEKTKAKDCFGFQRIREGK